MTLTGPKQFNRWRQAVLAVLAVPLLLLRASGGAMFSTTKTLLSEYESARRGIENPTINDQHQGVVSSP